MGSSDLDPLVGKDTIPASCCHDAEAEHDSLVTLRRRSAS